jgi:toxin CptA
MTSAPAIGFEYRPSHLLPCLLWTVAALALIAIALSGLPSWSKALLAMLVLLASGHAVRRWRTTPVRAAGWQADGLWSLRFADGSDASATLASSRVLGPVVLLRLRAMPSGGHVLLLATDNSDADIRRRLRMRLAVAPARPAAPPV